MIRMMCGVRLVDRVSTDVLRERVGFVVTIKDFIIQRRLQWYGHVIRRDISSQIREVMEHEIPGKRKKGRPRKSWEECIKKDVCVCVVCVYVCVCLQLEITALSVFFLWLLKSLKNV